MSDIPNVLEKLAGTSIFDVLVQIENDYENIAQVQHEWYVKTEFTCPEACGQCCINFEPDLMEAEALYMAAWIIEHQPEVAQKLADNEFPFNNGKTCPLYNPDSGYHCSIYGGRAFICRLFGASSFYSKLHQLTWRPCKFYPDNLLKVHNPPLEHRQYFYDEAAEKLGSVPPAMSDLLESSKAFSTDTKKTILLREILPAAVRKILWIINMNGNDNPNGSPNAPMAA